MASPGRKISRAEEIATDPIQRMIVRLIGAGFPYDVAHCLDFDELKAYCVVIGEIEGGTYNWARDQWEEPRDG